MKIIIEETCPKCEEVLIGIVDAFFIYKYKECVACADEHDENALTKYKEVFYDFQDGNISEDFFEVINIIIRNV